MDDVLPVKVGDGREDASDDGQGIRLAEDALLLHPHEELLSGQERQQQVNIRFVFVDLVQLDHIRVSDAPHQIDLIAD